MNIYTGRAASGKTFRILKTIRSKVFGGGLKQFLIVPELYSHEYERQLAEITENHAAGNAEVLTFRRIVSRVFSEVGGLAETSLSQAGRLLLMHEAVYRCGSGLTVYSGAEQRPDMIRALLSVIDEMKCYSISADKILQTVSELDGSLKSKMQDIGIILGVYEKLLTGEQLDPRDEMDRLIDRLPKSTLFDKTEVYFDGFSGFTPQEFAVIEGLCRKKISLTFGITCDKKLPEIFVGSHKTIHKLENIAKRNGEAIEIIDLGESVANKPHDLAVLERFALASNPEPNTSDKISMQLHAASSLFTECENAAGYIRRKIRENGARYRDFVIAARNITDYIPILEMVCKRYDLPVFISEKKDLLSKPVLTLVISALDTVLNGYRYEDMFSYLKTGLANIDENECDKLENYAIIWRVRGTLWHKAWTMNPDGYTGVLTDSGAALLSALNRIRESAIKPLEMLEDGLKSAETAAEYVSALYDFLDCIKAGEKIAQRADGQEAAGRLQTAEEYRQLWEILVSAMEQFAWVQSESKMTTDTFVKLFRMVLGEYDVGTIPVSMDSVTCGSIDRVCRTGVKNLILLGVNDGLLPKTPDDNGILTDSDRDFLMAASLELSPSASEQIMLEQEVIYKALSCPSDSLMLSWHQNGTDGSEKRPSFLIETIKKLLSGVLVSTEKEVAGAYRLEAPKPCFDAACCGAGGEWGTAANAAFDYYKDDTKLKAVCAGKSGIRGPVTDKALIHQLYGEQLRLTASRVDKFYSCKFAFFMQYGLYAKPRTCAGFDAPEAGTFIHFVLENTLNTLSERDGGVKAAEKTDVQKIAQSYIERYIETMLGGLESKSARFRYLFKRLVKMMMSILDNVIFELKNSDFAPIDFELDFSEKGDLPPVDVSTAEGTDMRISGKVDRVDGYIKGNKLYLRVMDYKSGVKAFDLSDIWHGLNMQLLIYLFALKKSGLSRYRKKISESIGEVIPAGALYVPVRDPILDAKRNSDEATIQKLRDKALKRSGIVSDDMTLINAMENGLEGDGRFIPVKINKSGEAGAASSVASLEKLGKLSVHISKKLSEMAGEVLSGRVDADPYYRNKTVSACDWCDFKAACQFDPSNGDKKRYLYPLKNQEFWHAIGGSDDGE